MEKLGLINCSKGKPNTIRYYCNYLWPPVMIKFTVVKKIRFSDDDIVTTLELKMKCGLEKCGRCIGNIYVCKDDCFTYKQMLAADEY